MSSRKAERSRQRRAKAAGPPADAQPRRRWAPLAGLILAGLAVVGFYFWLRAAAPQPWSYDEYYHLGVAREMRSDFRIESFRWAPLSVFVDRYADKEPLVHLLLMPLAGLSLERAGLFGVLLGQVFVTAAFGFVLWQLRVPAAPWFLLALAGVGPMFALRMDMLRPHLWLIAFSLLFLGLLAANASWKLLAAVAALFGLAHAGGWIAVAYAGLWAVVGFVSRERGDRRLEWRPAAAAAGGWLAGQLIHPNVPENFRLLWLQTVVVPYQSAAGGNEALQSQLGNEITPPELPILLDQWPAFVAPLFVVGLLAFRPQLRTRTTLTAAAVALGFLVLGSFFARRFFELAAPLAVFALAVVVRERRAAGMRRLGRGWIVAAALGIALGCLWTWKAVELYAFGVSSPPRLMAEWLGRNGRPGERVFTAQWADAAPLFYAAPQLESLVVLDPTFFYAKDSRLFATYVRIVQGRQPDPARVIRERFAAQWVTVWKAPVYERLVQQLARSRGVTLAYSDSDYLVFQLDTL